VVYPIEVNQYNIVYQQSSTSTYRIQLDGQVSDFDLQFVLVLLQFVGTISRLLRGVLQLGDTYRHLASIGGTATVTFRIT